jgi:hypothetical protein
LQLSAIKYFQTTAITKCKYIRRFSMQPPWHLLTQYIHEIRMNFLLRMNNNFSL